MFRKLFWAAILLGGYLWVVSEEDAEATKMAKMLYHYAEKRWQDLDLTCHIHTPGCLKKKR